MKRSNFFKNLTVCIFRFGYQVEVRFYHCLRIENTLIENVVRLDSFSFHLFRLSTKIHITEIKRTRYLRIGLWHLCNQFTIQFVLIFSPHLSVTRAKSSFWVSYWIFNDEFASKEIVTSIGRDNMIDDQILPIFFPRVDQSHKINFVL